MNNKILITTVTMFVGLMAVFCGCESSFDSSGSRNNSESSTEAEPVLGVVITREVPRSEIPPRYEFLIMNVHTGVTYDAWVYTDKGINPFDGYYEEKLFVGTFAPTNEASIPVVFTPRIGYNADYGVEVTDSLGNVARERGSRDFDS